MKTKQEFIDAYTNALEEVIRAYPDEYSWPINEAPIVALKMFQAIRTRGYNKDSRALKLMSKRYGFKYTYAGINSFVDSLI